MARQPIVGDFGVVAPLKVIPPKPRGSKYVWYKPNHRSFGAFMKSDQMRDVTEEVAKDIAALAAALAPSSKKKSGLRSKVKTGFKVRRSAGFIEVGGNTRVLVEVVNNVDGSALVEFGARQLPRARMLGRAGAAFGDFKPEGGPSS